MHTLVKNISSPLTAITKILTGYLFAQKASGNIVAFSFFGSMLETKPSAHCEDIDLVVLTHGFGVLSKKMVATLKHLLDQASRQYNVPTEIKIAYGPYRQHRQKKRSILLHLNLHTVETYKQRHTFLKWAIATTSRDPIFRSCAAYDRPNLSNLGLNIENHLRNLESTNFTIQTRDLQTLETSLQEVDGDFQRQEYVLFAHEMAIRNFAITLGCRTSKQFKCLLNSQPTLEKSWFALMLHKSHYHRCAKVVAGHTLIKSALSALYFIYDSKDSYEKETSNSYPYLRPTSIWQDDNWARTRSTHWGCAPNKSSSHRPRIKPL